MTLLTEKEQEQARQRRLREQARDREWRRFTDPERDLELEDAKVWVAHVWAPTDGVPDQGEWLFAGFRRRRNRRKPQTMGRFFAKVRRQLSVPKQSPVMLMDLALATRRINGADQSWRTRPPQFQKRKRKMNATKPALLVPTRTKQRARTKALLLNKRATKYIAIGRNSWDRAPGYLYFGPLQSQQKRAAQFEARRLFIAYNTILVLGVNELSAPLRNAMVRGKRVKAGVTRITWPEVPPSFDGVWAKFERKILRELRLGRELTESEVDTLVLAEIALRAEWARQEHPWLTVSWMHKQLKPERQRCAPKQRKSKRGTQRVASPKRATSARNRKQSARKTIIVRATLRRQG